MRKTPRPKEERSKEKARGGQGLKGFGARLRDWRDRRGLTQEDLARAAGSTWMQISRYERDVHLPALEKIAAIARVLRVSVDTLLWGETKPEEKLEFQNLRLYERLRELDRLPKDEQETVLRLIDAVLAKYELEHLAARVRRSA